MVLEPQSWSLALYRRAALCGVLLWIAGGAAAQEVRAHHGAKPECPTTPQVLTLGRATPGTSGLPELTLQGAPLPGFPFQLRVSKGLPGAVGFLTVGTRVGVSFSSALQAFLYSGGVVSTTTFLLDGQGTSPALLRQGPIPLSSCGRQLVVQGFVFDPAAAGGSAVTKALAIRIGESNATQPFPILRFAVGNEPWALALADLDQDGDMDQVAGELIDGISLRMGNGDGTFGTYELVPTYLNSARIASADFDGNGSTDVVSTLGGTDELIVIPFKAGGEFYPPRFYSAGDFPDDVAIGDWNDDGALDLAVANGLSDALTIHLGDGAGGFALASSLATQDFPQSLLSADFDLDGHEDLAVACSGTGRVLLHPGLPDAVFGTRVEFVFPGSRDSARFTLQASDLNRDALPDWIVNDGHKLIYMQGGGDGTFVGRELLRGDPDWFLVGDLNQDDIEDITIEAAVRGTFVRELRTFLGTAAATVIAGWKQDWGHTDRAQVLGDLDRDGDLDLLLANTFARSTSVLLGTGSGSFVIPPMLTRKPVGGLVVGDLNADQRPDIAFTSLANSGGQFDDLGLLLSRPDGTWSEEERVAGPRLQGIALDDYDRDGAPDVAVLTADVHRLLVFRGPDFAAFAITIVEFQPTQLASGDLDGDEIPDVVIANTIPNQFTTYSGVGDGTFVHPISRPSSTGVVALAIQDVDQDDARDLVVLDQRHVTVYLGNGSGDFAPSATLEAGQSPGRLGFGDLQDDGKLDLIVINGFSGELRPFAGRGDGAFDPLPSFFVAGSSSCCSDGPSNIALGDVDGDLRVDVVVTNSRSGDASVFLGHGDGTFAPELRLDAALSSIFNPTPRLALVDCNGDQVLDLVVGGGLGISLVDNLLLGQLDVNRRLEGSSGARFIARSLDSFSDSE